MWIWFHGSQSNKCEQKLRSTSRADPPTVLLNNSSMVHNQANMNRNSHLTCRLCSRMVLWFIIKQSLTETVIPISCANPPTVLLENGSMVHNQTNTDRLRKLLLVTFLDNVWLAGMTLKAKMERNRHVPNATRK